MTGLAGLALVLSVDSYPYRSHGGVRRKESEYDEPIRKAADWLMKQSDAGRDGLIFSGHPTETGRYMPGHGLATLFLTGAYEIEEDADRKKKLGETIVRAVKCIKAAQSSEGGWHETSKVEGHDPATIPSTAIQIQALQGVDNIVGNVEDRASFDGVTYLRNLLEKSRRRRTQVAPLARDGAASQKSRRSWPAMIRGESTTNPGEGDSKSAGSSSAP